MSYELVNHGFKESVILRKSTYITNYSLAIVVECENGEPYCTLTVNINDSDKYVGTDLAFVDTNNYPWAVKFLKKYDLATKTEVVGHSGFCTYPLYKFNLDKIPS